MGRLLSNAERLKADTLFRKLIKQGRAVDAAYAEYAGDRASRQKEAAARREIAALEDIRARLVPLLARGGISSRLSERPFTLEEWKPGPTSVNMQ